MNQAEFYPELALPRWSDRLRFGMLPRSFAFWVGLFYMATVVIRPWEVLIPELGQLRFERVFGVAMVGLVALAYKWEIRGGMTAIGILFFVAMMFLTSMFAVWPELCDRDLTALVSTLISFFVIVFIVRSTYLLYFMLFAYIGIVFVYMTKAEYEYFVNGAAQYAMGVRRLGGIEQTYGHPNAVGGSVVCSLPIAYFLYTIRHDFCSTWPKLFRRLFPMFLWTYAAVAVSTALLTRSRTAAICMAAMVLLTAFSGKSGVLPKVRRLAIVGLVLVVGFFFLPSDMQGRIQTVWDSSVEKNGAHQGATESKEGRLVGFLQGMKMFKRYPLTGVGLSNFKEYRVAKGDGTFLDAHNLAGEVLSETGLLGASSFVFLLGVMLLNITKARKLAKRSSHPDAAGIQMLSVSCLHVLMMLLLQGVTSHNLHRYNWFWLAAFTALCLRQARLLAIEEQQFMEVYDEEDFDYDYDVESDELYESDSVSNASA